LTGSALNLGLASAVQMTPYLLFGLVIGAWVDRVDRKRLMIVTDLARAVVIASIPLLAAFDSLTVMWVYLASFLNATLSIAFDSAQFAAIPSLVETDDLVTANGRIQASFSAMMVVGPLVAGGLVSFAPIETLFLIDAGSFLVSAVFLATVARGFNSVGSPLATSTIRQDIVEGLRYVWNHPVLRAISIMMALVNFFGSTFYAQMVLFATERLNARDARLGLLFAAEAAGVVVISLAAGWLRKRWSFGAVALGSLMIQGIVTVGLAALTDYWAALGLISIIGGVGILFNINTSSLRQEIVPNHLLGRVISVAGVISWSAIPLGTLLGGALIEQTGEIAVLYAAIGVVTFLIAFAFRFSAIGHADRYAPTAGDGSGAPDESGARPNTRQAF
jgi:MFS family permease